MKTRDRVFALLTAVADSEKPWNSKGMTIQQIADITDAWFGMTHISLMQLEAQRKVVSEWVPGPYPRHKLYRLSALTWTSEKESERELTDAQSE